MSEQQTTSWYVRPSVILPVVAALIVLTALMAREPRSGRDSDPRLTTYSHESQGASAIYELAQRLGWHTQRRTRKEFFTSSDVVHAELDPAVPLRAAEAHEILEHVRAGGALLLVLDQDKSELADSLNIKLGLTSGLVALPSAERSAQCGKETKLAGFVTLWPSNRAQLYTLAWKTRPSFAIDTLLMLENVRTPAGVVVIDTITSVPNDSAVRHTSVNGATNVTDTLNANALGTSPALLGFELGKGRVVVASDPDFLRNDALRVCRFGLDVAAVHALEYLRDGGSTPRNRIVFDEYHQRYNAQPGTVRTVSSFLADTQAGHVLFQVLAASLVLLVSLMPRAISPREHDRVERRSPLEHVDALARAYAQVGGTRTASTLLVRGMRRRVERASSRGADQNTNERFLERIEFANPSLKQDLGVIRAGLTTQLSPKDFAAFGAAIKRVELSLARI